MGVDFIITYFKFFCTIMKLIHGCTYSKLAEEAQKETEKFYESNEDVFITN